MNEVLRQALGLTGEDKCLYPSCSKVLAPGEGITHGRSQRYCDDACFEAFRCWVGTQMMLVRFLVDWAEAIAARYPRLDA